MARFEVDQASIRLADDLFEKPDDLLRPHCDLMQQESARDANQIGRLSTNSFHSERSLDDTQQPANTT